MTSLWKETAQKPQFASLEDDLKTDVLIVGGGLTGLLCAYLLKKAGLDYALVEADEICGGTTKNTTAKITSQHRLIYHDLIKRFGEQKAEAYLNANQAAIDKYREICKTVDCDFEEKDAFVYSLDKPRKIEKELRALEKLGFLAGFSDCPNLPFQVAGAVKFERQAQFHPLKFAYAIAKDLKIYEHTEVKELAPKKAVTDRGVINAEKIVVATHFPILNKHGLYFLKMFQHRSYVVALKNAAQVDGMYIDEYDKGLSFRNYGEYLLLGGGSHRTGEKGGNWRDLESAAEKYYPNAQEAYRWAAQDCMTLDDAPYIGKYSKSTQDLYVATGYNKWGMTSAMVAAQILTDELKGEKNEYAAAFTPQRSMLRAQLAVNGAKAIWHLITPTVPRCPHMGCALKYNPHEHSWDCPCHGSRFTKDGKLIDNPATENLKR
ncbi:MAG: FAD-dependent oxidoreductase [Clostridia bacterium]|nr:FAD-dependent oxidoreductase [Clostridia bacterium]